MVRSSRCDEGHAGKIHQAPVPSVLKLVGFRVRCGVYSSLVCVCVCVCVACVYCLVQEMEETTIQVSSLNTLDSYSLDVFPFCLAWLCIHISCSRTCVCSRLRGRHGRQPRDISRRILPAVSPSAALQGRGALSRADAAAHSLSS